MQARRLLRLLLLAIPVASTAVALAPAPRVPLAGATVVPGPSISISAPRQSLPQPVHDEATCAFCQAAAFAPHTARATANLPDTGTAEHREFLSPADRLTHSGTSRPPRSRAPPVLRDV